MLKSEKKREGGEPRYLQIAHILAARLEKESALPATLALAEEFDVSHKTIENAMRVLAGANLIRRLPRRGTVAVSALDPFDPLVNSNSIGLVFPASGYDRWQSMLKLMHATAEKSGCSLDVYLYRWNDLSDERRALGKAVKNCSAVIIYPNSLGNDRELIREFNAVCPMLVQFMLSFEDLDTASVTNNNFQAARELTRRFIRRGARRIAFIHPLMALSTPAARLAGYKEGLRENGIELSGDLIIDSENVRDIKKILDRHEADAAICGKPELMDSPRICVPRAIFTTTEDACRKNAALTALIHTEELAHTVIEEAIRGIRHPDSRKRRIIINLEITESRGSE